MRLIDADALIDDIRKNSESYFADDFAHIWVDKQTPVEAQPVRHGRWIGYPECLKYKNALDDSDIVCSVCGEAFDILDNDTERFDYCPHCGAKMGETK